LAVVNPLCGSTHLRHLVTRVPVFEEVVQSCHTRDLVLVCSDGQQLLYHADILAALSPVVKQILAQQSVQTFRMVQSAQVFISLAGVKSGLVKRVMDSVYNLESCLYTQSEEGELAALMAALGVPAQMYQVSKVDVDDQTIVDVIHNLMEEFKVNPDQSQKDWEDMLMDNLDESFVANISEYSVISNIGLEALMEESTDFSDFSFPPSLEEEAHGIGLDPASYRLEDCFVDMPNLSNQTLQKYTNILEESSRTKKRKDVPAATRETPLKRKRTKNIKPDFEYPLVKVKAEKVEAITDENHWRNMKNIEENNDDSRSSVASSADVQFVEAKQVPCHMCGAVFQARSRLLQHLCSAHFAVSIRQKFPFVKDAPCPLCLQAGKTRPFKQSNGFLLHIGQTHEVVLQFVSAEFAEAISQFARCRRRPGGATQPRIKQEKVEVGEEELSNSSLISIGSQDSNSLISSASQDNSLISIGEDSNSNSGLGYQNTQERRGRSLLCSLCPVSDLVSFHSRPAMLSHLSSAHLTSELLSLAPPPPDWSCPTCLETSATRSSFPSQVRWAQHQGAAHEKVLAILPSDFVDRINDMTEEEEPVAPLKVKFEPEDFAPSLNSTFVEPQSSSCDLCGLKGLTNKLEFLLHYTAKHFIEQLTKKFPFKEGSQCKLCSELSRNFSPKNATHYMKHIGVFHRKVTEYMSQDARDILEVFEKKKTETKAISIAKGASLSQAKELSCKYCDLTYLNMRDLKQHLLSHKKDFTKV